MFSQQTKKKKKSKKSLKKLWNAFESVENKEKKLELLYESQNLRQRERCDLCNSAVAYTQKKILTCSNPSCAVVYKDVLDETAEWRYYGADDNSMSDPTRCGMPINPLLKESSYGCKVICGGRSSYEMR